MSSEPSKTLPRVSVVVPTYNAPGMLLRTLESVFAQTFQDIEVVVINDGSTDDTAERLQPLAHAGRIRLINQINVGIGAARNRGIEEARGELVATLDHDDLWEPRKLETQVDYLQTHPSVVACGVVYRTQYPREISCPDIRSLLDSDGIITRPSHRLAQGHVLVISSTLMFYRKLYPDCRYETARNAIEDVPFYLRLFGKGPIGIAWTQEALATYFMHASNSSRANDYHINGYYQIARLDAEGAFAEARARYGTDVNEWITQLARLALGRQLAAGHRRQAFALWMQRLPDLLRFGEWRGALGLLPALLAPRSWAQRRWQQSR